MNAFNIRVYGVLITEEDKVLVSDEMIRGALITKFPGGGLEFGEGTRDCLRREYQEELDLSIEVTDHLYTTDFFQESAFDPGNQIISIYYRVRALEPIKPVIREAPFDFDAAQLETYRLTGECETFRLIPLHEIDPQHFHLPIDKIVAEMLKSFGNRNSL